MAMPPPSAATPISPFFADRQAAGEQLALAILDMIQAAAPDPAADPATNAVSDDRADYIVYALPKGGIPVAVPIAQALRCPLDVIVSKKITRPANPEYALGAITADGHTVWAAACRPDQRTPQLAEPAKRQAGEQAWQLGEHLSPAAVQGKIAIVVDDGIATGMTMAAAVASLRSQQPAQVWIAAPVAPVEAVADLESWGDRLILLGTPMPFYSVSRFYRAFPQVTMAEAIAGLRAAQGDGNL